MFCFPRTGDKSEFLCRLLLACFYTVDIPQKRRGRVKNNMMPNLLLTSQLLHPHSSLLSLALQCQHSLLFIRWLGFLPDASMLFCSKWILLSIRKSTLSLRNSGMIPFHHSSTLWKATRQIKKTKQNKPENNWVISKFVHSRGRGIPNCTPHWKTYHKMLFSVSSLWSNHHSLDFLSSLLLEIKCSVYRKDTEPVMSNNLSWLLYSAHGCHRKSKTWTTLDFAEVKIGKLWPMGYILSTSLPLWMKLLWCTVMVI